MRMYLFQAQRRVVPSPLSWKKRFFLALDADGFPYGDGVESGFKPTADKIHMCILNMKGLLK
jgi:hypothetical protein